ASTKRVRSASLRSENHRLLISGTRSKPRRAVTGGATAAWDTLGVGGLRSRCPTGVPLCPEYFDRSLPTLDLDKPVAAATSRTDLMAEREQREIDDLHLARLDDATASVGAESVNRAPLGKGHHTIVRVDDWFVGML